ncbi:Druantia anti-phage system protein DruA, partial [uncultured Candidatus Kuenenia sp.]
MANIKNTQHWEYLFHHYHYLGNPRLVGEHLRHIVRIGNQVVACLGWASAVWKVKDRDRLIEWDETTKPYALRHCPKIIWY